MHNEVRTSTPPCSWTCSVDCAGNQQADNNECYWAAICASGNDPAKYPTEGEDGYFNQGVWDSCATACEAGESSFEVGGPTDCSNPRNLQATRASARNRVIAIAAAGGALGFAASLLLGARTGFIVASAVGGTVLGATTGYVTDPTGTYGIR